MMDATRLCQERAMGAGPVISSPNKMPRVWGFLLGAVVMAAGYIAGILPMLDDPYAEEFANPGALLVIAVLGYVAAVAMAIKPPSRALGQGMLLGLSLLLPVALAGLLAANLGGLWWQ
jgi:hypothetical protein